MQVVVRLVGTSKDAHENEVLRLESSSDKSHADQLAVFNYIKQNTTVLGLAYKMSGDGVITYSAAANALRSDIVSDMQTVIQNALDRI